jgi:predicted DCC family thiol-disulfide oxidoreductase YuxK
MNGKQTHIKVWFDSQCPLCAQEIAFMKRLDWFKRVEFVDIYATADCPLDPQQLLARFHAQESGQRIVNGAAAFAALWRHLPLLRPLGALARIPLVLRTLERAYVRFLRIRPALQRYLGV